MRQRKSPSKPTLPVVSMYTDGSCYPNPGLGGWGAYLMYKKHRRELWGGVPLATNNQMELRGPIEGLRALKGSCAVTVYSDSQYVCKGASEWLAKWAREGWRTTAGKPIKNKEIWQELIEASERHTVTWQWVRGHVGNEGNEHAHNLANRGRLEMG